jgi:hypothetical protein
MNPRDPRPEVEGEPTVFENELAERARATARWGPEEETAEHPAIRPDESTREMPTFD